MATTLNINIADDAKAARIIAAVSETYGYQEQIPDPAFTPEAGPGVGGGPPAAAPMVPNPQTRKQFVQQQIKNWLREATRAHELDQARVAAMTSADTIGEI
jgi:hypothetical protein